MGLRASSGDTVSEAATRASIKEGCKPVSTKFITLAFLIISNSARLVQGYCTVLTPVRVYRTFFYM